MMASPTSEEFTGVGSIQEMMDVLLPLTEGSSHPMLALGPVDGADPHRGRGRCPARPGRDRPTTRTRGCARPAHDAQRTAGAERWATSTWRRTSWRRAGAAFSEIGDRTGLIVTLTGMAEVAMARAQPDEAVRLLEQARGYAAEGLARNLGEMLRVPARPGPGRTGDLAGARADLRARGRLAGRIGEHDDRGRRLRGAQRPGPPRGRPGRGRTPAGPRAGGHRAAGRQSGHAGRGRGRLQRRCGSLAEQAATWRARAALARAGPGRADRAGPDADAENPALAGVVEGIAALAAARGEHARSRRAARPGRTRCAGYRNHVSLEVARARSPTWPRR